ncbi:MAG: ribosome biogenesis GTPase YlqF [Anaerofustis stercorihominis]|nr:ribosome biogenesis GTPase YlqF [Anaerofustis stercorihominis]
MAIQWYPGHMAKATRQIKEQLKNIDIIIILGDSRAVQRSIIGNFFDVIGNKRYCLVYNKSDLADENAITQWKTRFREEGIDAFFIDCISKKGIKELVTFLSGLKEKFRFDREVKVMIAGIPNVGKSMLINSIAGRSSAQTGNRPGVTKANKWVRVNKDFYLLDTPGVLTPKFDAEEDGFVLAAIGSVKDTVFDREELALKIIEFMSESYPDLLMERYKLKEIGTPLETYEQIGINRGFKSKGGIVDYERTANMILDEFKNGKIGKIAFDKPEKDEENESE